jgi:uncharacterized membrane protein
MVLDGTEDVGTLEYQHRPELSMSTSPLFASSFAIQVHVAAALGAMLVGAAQFVGKKGKTAHRVLGWAWVGLMLLTALSSFWIVNYRNPGPTSFILILSVLVLVQVPLAVRFARLHQVQRHRWTMTLLYINALLVSGAFTLLPGRLMHRVVFG